MSVETEASGAAAAKSKGDPNVQTETD